MDDFLYIIIPIYNAAATIERTVRSLTRIEPHNRHRVKVIAVDDGSTDGSGQLFQKTLAEVSGIDSRLICKTNGGSGSARNKALRTFNTGWTLCLDADDELVGDPLPFIDRAPEATALLFDADYQREEKSLFRIRARQPNIKKLPQMFSARSPYCTLSIVFRRELLENLYAEDLRFLEDWHFLATNPSLFANCVLHCGTAIGRVHGGKQSKSADQYKNGYYRVVVAKRLAKYWVNEHSAVVENNLEIQRTIGQVQMRKSASLKALLCLPASISLYAKLLIYLFGYRLYLRLYPYA
jgi:glycosyltransferase involved in cell wall biosynthesis